MLFFGVDKALVPPPQSKGSKRKNIVEQIVFHDPRWSRHCGQRSTGSRPTAPSIRTARGHLGASSGGQQDH
eukprot:6136300-Pyramimonas_sp.AAC.1